MSFSQPFALFQSPISSPAAAAAAANRRVARAPPGTKTARHGRTNMLQDRTEKVPPGTKTARHGRTNMPQNRTEKVPNVPSEFLEKMSVFFLTFSTFSISHQLTCCCCCPKAPPRHKTAVAAAAAANRRVAKAPPGTKTARHGRTNRP